jgi:hypothetical protein
VTLEELRQLVADADDGRPAYRREPWQWNQGYPEFPKEQRPQTDEEKVLEYVRQHGSINNTECRDLLHVGLHRASHLLKRMHAHGALRRESERRWARYYLP